MPEPSVFERVVAEALNEGNLPVSLLGWRHRIAAELLRALATSDEVRAALSDVYYVEETDGTFTEWSKVGTVIADAILAALRPESA